MKLSDIAEVRTGLVLARKAAEPDTEAARKYRQLNLKCIRDAGEIDVDELDIFLSTKELGASYLTYPEDIIVRLSAPYTAVLISNETQGIVVSSHFCIIRIQNSTAVPAYIKWLLNSQMVKAQIVKNSTSSTYASIKPSFYSELEIEPLPIMEQHRIANLYSTGQRELALLDELRKQKEQLYQAALSKLYHQKKW